MANRTTLSSADRIATRLDIRDMGNLLERAGFVLTTIDVDDITVNYPSIFELMADLGYMGESNAVFSRLVLDV